MKRIQSCQILLLLLLMVCVAAQATLVMGNFEKIESEITGKIGSELTAGSKQECAIRCLDDRDCVAFKYQTSRSGNCALIQENSTAAEGQVFEQKENSDIYRKVLESIVLESIVLEGKVSELPAVAYHQSFDSLDGFDTIMAVEVDDPILVPGKVNNAVSTNRSSQQWVDLGIHTEACMTQVKCDTGSGAISLWIKILDYGGNGAILSTRDSTGTGSVLRYYDPNLIRANLELPDGYVIKDTPAPAVWFHFVLNYNDSTADKIQIFKDGEEAEGELTGPSSGSLPYTSGRIVVGKHPSSHGNGDYGSMQVDELYFFNQSLSLLNVKYLYNLV